MALLRSSSLLGSLLKSTARYGFISAAFLSSPSTLSRIAYAGVPFDANVPAS